MCDENNQLPNAVPVFNATASGNAVFSQNTALRYCAACMTWVSSYHDCAYSALAPSASLNFWKCGACGQYVSGAFHTCAPLMLTPAQPERKPHVCPVCTGKGVVVDVEESRDCPACKGACVLWG